MYVELDTCQTERKQVDLDVQALRNELSRLGGEKSSYFEQIRQLMGENESFLKQLKSQQVLNNEQSGKIEKLKAEKDAVNKELVETKMRSAREKEELARNLEQLEREIVKRERDMFVKQYEQVLVQNCEAVRADEARKYAALSEQLRQK